MPGQRPGGHARSRGAHARDTRARTLLQRQGRIGCASRTRQRDQHRQYQAKLAPRRPQGARKARITASSHAMKRDVFILVFAYTLGLPGIGVLPPMLRHFYDPRSWRTGTPCKFSSSTLLAARHLLAHWATSRVNVELWGPETQRTGNIATMTAVDRYLEAAERENTRRSYASALHHFEVRWGGFLPATSDSVARYLAENAGNLAINTLKQHLAALAHWHREQGFAESIATYVATGVTSLWAVIIDDLLWCVRALRMILSVVAAQRVMLPQVLRSGVPGRSVCSMGQDP